MKRKRGQKSEDRCQMNLRSTINRIMKIEPKRLEFNLSSVFCPLSAGRFKL